MDLKSLQVFLAVASNLSFTQTAGERHMSVSAVSRCISRLEEALGERLFERDRRGMQATAAAAELQIVAERMLADWRSLQQSLNARTGVQGELRIFCSVTASHRLLSPLLSAYREAYPRVQILLQTGDQADGVERVRGGHADVAVVARPAELHESLAFSQLATTPLCLCIPGIDCRLRETLKGVPEPALWEALANAPWILPQRGVSRDIIDKWLQRRFDVSPAVYARVAGHEAIAAMVSLGLGVAVLPRLVIDGAGAESELELLSVLPDLPPFDIGLCARSVRIDDPVLRGLWQAADGSDVGGR